MSLRELRRSELLVNTLAAAALLPVYRRREWRTREATRAWQGRLAPDAGAMGT